MRNIQFKGIHNYIWVHGDLIRKSDGIFIGNVETGIYQVADETVSEFTGLYDHTELNEVSPEERQAFVETYNKALNKTLTESEIEDLWDGRPIYENDMLRCVHVFDPQRIFQGQVVFIDGGFCVYVTTGDKEYYFPLSELDEFRIVNLGSIFVIKEPPAGEQ